MKLLLDEMYSPALARALSEHGIDTVSVRDWSMSGSSDAAVLAAAVNRGYAVMTENVADFTRLAADYGLRGETHQGVIVALSSRFSRRRSGVAAIVTAVSALEADSTVARRGLTNRVVFPQVLDKFADGLAEADFVAALDAGLADRPRAGSVALTVSERAFLDGEGITIDGPKDTSSTVHQAAGDIIDLATDSLSVPDVAEMLGVDAGRIRHRVSDRSLYAFKVGRQLRLPRWQFTSGTPREALPGLRTVLAAVDDDASPVELARFVSTPQADLDLAGTAVTPRDWLLAGRSAAAVRSILEDRYEW